MLCRRPPPRAPLYAEGPPWRGACFLKGDMKFSQRTIMQARWILAVEMVVCFYLGFLAEPSYDLARHLFFVGAASFSVSWLAHRL